MEYKHTVNRINMIKQSEFGRLRMALGDKINEYGEDQGMINAVIESFIVAMDAFDWSIEDQIELLLATAKLYKTGYAKVKLENEATAIQVNNGL